VQHFLQAREWRFCIIGGLAVVRWGEPRATQDVDVSLLTGLGAEEQYVDLLLEAFGVRIEDARKFALDHRVVLARASNGVSLDIALAGFPYEEQLIARASAFEFAPGATLTTASAEDLVVLKAFAARDRDWVDIDGIVTRQSNRLDWHYIMTMLGPLCELKGTPETVDRLQRIRQGP
jgi:hypothetical protein